MGDLSICCICLTADRQAFTDRAVRCFLSQTYRPSWLLIYDTGQEPYVLPDWAAGCGICIAYCKPSTQQTIGALRNQAIDMAGKAEAIAHWDSDDWSEANRLAVQAEQLAHSRTAVGFHNVLFADTRYRVVRDGIKNIAVGVWEYDYHRYVPESMSARVVGASLAYWREVWQHQPFNEAKHVGEDSEWHKLVPLRAYNGVDSRPLLIAEVHGKNTSGVYGVFDKHNPAFNPEWRRAPEWDQYCRERLYP